MTKRVGSGPASAGLRQAVGSSCLTRRSAVRHQLLGMTLIELLIAISIVAILATLLLGVAARAAETAREARTKQLVSRLHTLVMERYESYRTRRVEIASNWDTQFNTANTGIDLSPLSGNEQKAIKLAVGRLVGIRELMKIEMPDRWSDVLLEDVPATPVVKLVGGTGPSAAASPLFVAQRSSLNLLYLRRYNETVGVTRETLLENEQAECLYLVIMNATSDGEARSLFKESDIGDTDEDGAPEFIDAWGNPIGWLRWAPGYDSDLQTNYASLKRVHDRPTDGSKGPFGIDGVEETIAKDHDPFDLFQADKFFKGSLVVSDMSNARGWRLFPLVFSAGADEEEGLYLGDSDLPQMNAQVNPYANDVESDPGNQRLGGLSDPDKATDNITNHHITAK